MATQLDPLIQEGQSLGIFSPHSATEVHCSHCHARLNARGDCDTCGLIGRSAQDVQQRARSDPGVEKRLGAAIAKRKAFKPEKPEKR